MPAPTRSERQTSHLMPLPTGSLAQFRLTSFTDPLDKTQTPQSAGHGAFDVSATPPSRARMIILCFDGTCDQFDMAVRPDPVCNALLSSYRPSLLAEFEHCPVCLDAQEGR